MDYTSSDFKVQYISTYTLYINSDWVNDQVVVVNQDNRVLLHKVYEASAPSQEVTKLLSLPFPRVYITLPHQQLTCIPTEVYDEDERESYQAFFDNEDHIWHKEIKSLNVTVLYQFDMLLFHRWKRLFPDASFIPVFEVTLQQAQPQIPIRGAVLGAYVYDRKTDLFLFKDGSFQFYNTFETTTVDDLSYFVLQLFKNFGVEGKVNKVLLAGTERDSVWGRRLSTYGDDLQLIQPKTRWSVPDEGVGSNEFGVLADSALCAS